MHFAETRQLVDQAFEFPIERDSVVEQLGDVELTPPAGDTVTVGEVLALGGETTYRSTDDLYAAIVGNLTDRFVGRKYYDDRAGVRVGAGDDRTGDDRGSTL